jgi:hypothetical protein
MLLTFLRQSARAESNLIFGMMCGAAIGPVVPCDIFCNEPAGMRRQCLFMQATTLIYKYEHQVQFQLIKLF